MQKNNLKIIKNLKIVCMNSALLLLIIENQIHLRVRYIKVKNYRNIILLYEKL